jgi:hypothetical protein
MMFNQIRDKNQEGTSDIVEDRFSLAGWISIITAVILPLAWIMEGLFEAFYAVGLTDRPVNIGPADFLFLLFAAGSIYVYWKLKHLMFEHYSFKEIGLIIDIAIVWHIVFFGGSFLMELILASIWPGNLDWPSLTILIFWIFGIVIFGIIDIIIGVILIRRMHEFCYPIKIFGILSLIIGFFEATVILVPVTLVLVPASLVALAFAFLQKPKVVEFV